MELIIWAPFPLGTYLLLEDYANWDKELGKQSFKSLALAVG